MVTVQRCINVLLTYLFTLVVLLQSRNRSRTIVGVKIAAAWVVSFIIAYPRPARTSSKRPTLSRVGRGTLTQSVNHSLPTDHTDCLSSYRRTQRRSPVCHLQLVLSHLPSFNRKR